MPLAGPRILMLGGDSDHNVGDRAILFAVARSVASVCPTVEVTAVSSCSHDPHASGISRTLRRGPAGLPELLHAAAMADRIVVVGGGLFQDDDSRAKMPYWAARLALVGAVNRTIVGHCLGAGPLRHPESRLAARLACSALASVSVRDRLARQTLRACTSRDIAVVPDPAFMLDPKPRGEARDFLDNLGVPRDRPIVVAAVRRYYHARGGFVPNMIKVRSGLPVAMDTARFESMLEALAEALEGLARRLDATILLLPSYNVAHEADDAACAALARRIRGRDVRIASIIDPALYKAVLGHATLVVSARMHPLILAAGMGVPVVGLSYNDKFEGFFDQLGTTPRVLRLDDFPDRWNASALEALAEAALDDRFDLRNRSELLAKQVRQATLDAVLGGLREGAAEALDA